MTLMIQRISISVTPPYPSTLKNNIGCHEERVTVFKNWDFAIYFFTNIKTNLLYCTFAWRVNYKASCTSTITDSGFISETISDKKIYYVAKDIW